MTLISWNLPSKPHLQPTVTRGPWEHRAGASVLGLGVGRVYLDEVTVNLRLAAKAEGKILGKKMILWEVEELGCGGVGDDA